MVNYRIFRIDNVNSGSTVGNINSVDASVVPTGSTGQKLDKVWGVMKDHSTSTATIRMAGGGSLLGGHMIAGEIYPCHPISITVTSGSFQLLS
jgi:hypothetical protein